MLSLPDTNSACWEFSGFVAELPVLTGVSSSVYEGLLSGVPSLQPKYLFGRATFEKGGFLAETDPDGNKKGDRRRDATWPQSLLFASQVAFFAPRVCC